MIAWMNITLTGIPGLWEKLCVETEEQVLCKYQVEECRRNAFRGDWPLCWEVKVIKFCEEPMKWRADCWSTLSSFS